MRSRLFMRAAQDLRGSQVRANQALQEFVALSPRGPAVDGMLYALLAARWLRPSDNEEAALPHDLDELRQCLKILELQPELRGGLSLMADQPGWDVLVAHVDEMLPQAARTRSRRTGAPSGAGREGRRLRMFTPLERSQMLQAKEEISDASRALHSTLLLAADIARHGAAPGQSAPAA